MKIKQLCQENRHQEALNVIEVEMKNLGVRPSRSTFGAIIPGLIRGRHFSKALMMLDVMRTHGIPPSVLFFNLMIDGYIKTDQLALAQSLFERMKDAGIAPNNFTYNSLINAHLRNGEEQEAADLVSEMKRKGIDADEITHTSLLHHNVRKGKLSAAEKQLEEMKKMGLKPNVISFNSVLHGCLNEDDLDKCFKYLREMEASNVQPDALSYETVMQACTKQNKMRQALELFAEMKSKNVAPTERTYGILIQSCVKAPTPQLETAFTLFEEMKANPSRKPSVFAYNILINGCTHKGQWGHVTRLLEEMKKEGLEMNEITYCTLVSGRARVNQLAEAYEYIQQMKNDETLTASVLSPYIGGCVRNGQWMKAYTEWMAFFNSKQQMKQSMQTDPGSVEGIYKFLIGHEKSAGEHIDLKLKLFEDMKGLGFSSPVPFLYRTLIRGCELAGKPQEDRSKLERDLNYATRKKKGNKYFL